MTPKIARRTPLELAAGQALEPIRTVALDQVEPAATPRIALDDAMLPSLSTGRCLVSFSGGRDSSAVLAAATALARREGVSLPVPVTMHFPGHALSDELEWQEEIVRTLGLDDWIRLEVGDELHILGPVARGLVHRHGVVFPPNAHLHVPIFELARGGTLLTGIGGDEIVGGVRWSRTAAVLAGETSPRLRDVLGVGFSLTPMFVRRGLSRRSLRGIAPWLRSGPRRQAIRSLASHWGAEPINWSDRFRWWLEAPYLQAAQNTFEVLAHDNHASVLHPLLDDRFVATVSRLPVGRRWSTRSSGMRVLFADVLPDAVLKRAGKASFGHVFAPDPRIELVRRWRGEGVDPKLVDPAALRRAWTADPVDPSSIPLLQHVDHVLEQCAQPPTSSSMSSVT